MADMHRLTHQKLFLLFLQWPDLKGESGATTLTHEEVAFLQRLMSKVKVEPSAASSSPTMHSSHFAPLGKAFSSTLNDVECG